MQQLTLADFSEWLQSPFPVTAGEQKVMLMLIQATKGAGGIPGGREPFSLLFRGPSSPRLAQAMHDFEHPRHGTLAIFIVPVGADADGILYEAIFS